MRARAVGTALVFVLVAAFGQGAAAQPVVTAPDVVRLRDGGLLRGTIAELVVGDHLTIVLVTGETRRVVAADFSFAGPVEESPHPAPTTVTSIPPVPAEDAQPPPVSAARPSAAPSTGGARVRFRSIGGERVVIDAAVATSGTPRYANVCTTPCSLVIPVGAYHVALTRRGLPRLTVEHLVPIEDRDLVEVEYETRNGARVGGLVLIGIAGGAGIAIGLAPLAIDERTRDRAIPPAIIAGVAVAALGALVGILMHGTDDGAQATVTHHEDDDDDDGDDAEETE